MRFAMVDLEPITSLGRAVTAEFYARHVKESPGQGHLFGDDFNAVHPREADGTFAEKGETDQTGKGDAEPGFALERATAAKPAPKPAPDLKHGDKVSVPGLTGYTEIWGEVGPPDDLGIRSVQVMNPETRHKLWTNAAKVGKVGFELESDPAEHAPPVGSRKRVGSIGESTLRREATQEGVSYQLWENDAGEHYLHVLDLDSGNMVAGTKYPSHLAKEANRQFDKAAGTKSESETDTTLEHADDKPPAAESTPSSEERESLIREHKAEQERALATLKAKHSEYAEMVSKAGLTPRSFQDWDRDRRAAILRQSETWTDRLARTEGTSPPDPTPDPLQGRYDDYAAAMRKSNIEPRPFHDWKAGLKPAAITEQVKDSQPEPEKTDNAKGKLFDEAKARAEIDAAGSGTGDRSLLAKKERLEAKIDRINGQIDRSRETDMPGTFITGNSGVPASRRRQLDRQLDRTIDRAKEHVAAIQELRHVESKIAHQEAGPKREAIESHAERIKLDKWRALKVGDEIDIGGNDPIVVAKKNRFSVQTTSGGTWTLKELHGIDHARAAELLAEIEPAKPPKPPAHAKTAAKLRELADGMAEAADSDLNRDRKTNTRKRSEEARYAIEGAYARQAAANTLRNLADHLEGGNAQHLAGVKNRAQVEALDLALRRGKNEAQRGLSYREMQETDGEPYTEEHARAAKFPFPYIRPTHVKDALATIKGKPGSAKIAAALERYGYGDGRKMTSESDLEALDGLIAMGEKYGSRDVRWLKDARASYNRLRSAGITPDNFNAALEEYRQLKSYGEREPAWKAKERALIGQKIPGFFPTPKKVIGKMLDRADIQPGMSVLEPSAGKGDILDALASRHPEAKRHAIEISPGLRELLKAKGHGTHEDSDFLEHHGEYDRIVQNPPFENHQDIEHVRHAYSLLKPGGRLVSVMSTGPFQRSQRKDEEFRQWFESAGGEMEPLEAGSFAGQDAFRQTGVSTVLVTMDKPK